MVPVFNSDNEMWTETNTYIGSLKAAANLTAGEQARLTAIDARSQWSHRDINDFCYLVHATMIRRSGATD